MMLVKYDYNIDRQRGSSRKYQILILMLDSSSHSLDPLPQLLHKYLYNRPL